MSGNLAEFLKVLTIVVSWSTLILVGRHYMLSIDSSRDEVDEDENPIRELEVSGGEVEQKEYEEAV